MSVSELRIAKGLDNSYVVYYWTLLLYSQGLVMTSEPMDVRVLRVISIVSDF